MGIEHEPANAVCRVITEPVGIKIALSPESDGLLELNRKQLPWATSGAKAHLDELEYSHISLSDALNMLLEARWRGEKIMSRNGHETSVTVYEGMIPTHPSLNQSTILGLLDKLKIGPNELRQITNVRYQSLFAPPKTYILPENFGASLTHIENLAARRRIPPLYGSLIEEIRTRFKNLSLS